VAHEDDAQRAVRTGLGIIEAMGVLNTRLEQDKGITLAVRLGIHTGLVVVGEMGSQGRHEQLALGEVPNLASRLQGLAEPNTLVVSQTTYGLVHGYFTVQELGEQTLRGVAEPIAVYRVFGGSAAQSRLEVASPRGLTPLVGRDSEVTLLLERWEQARQGHGQVVLLMGEGGIGKSRLVMAVKEHVAGEPHTRWECRCSPYFQDSALYPLIDLAQRALQFGRDESPASKLQKLAAVLGHSQTCPYPGHGLSLVAAEHPPAVSPAHCAGVDGAVSRARRDTTRTARAALYRGGPQRPGSVLLAAGGPAGQRALGLSGGDCPPHQRAGGAQHSPGHARAHPARAGSADEPGAGVDGAQGVVGSRSGTRLCAHRRCVNRWDKRRNSATCW
jgi:hypothetical protein